MKHLYSKQKKGKKPRGKLKGFQNYKAMAAMYSRKMKDTEPFIYKGKKYYEYITPDYRGVGRRKIRKDWELGIGLGHIIQPDEDGQVWTEVLVVFPDGRQVVGYRKIPGVDDVSGKKIGYFTAAGKYIATYTTKPPTRVYLLKKGKPRINEEYAFYEKKEGAKQEPAKIASLKPYVPSTPKKRSTPTRKPRPIMGSVASVPPPSPRPYIPKKKLRGYPFRYKRSKEVIISTAKDPARLRRFLKTVNGLSITDRIIEIALHITENNIKARHCTDWVNSVYKLAGVQSKARIYHDLSYAYKYEKGKKVRRPKGDPYRSRCGKVHFPFGKLKTTFKKGDQFYGNGWNNYWSGNHDMIFWKWENKSKGIATVISWRGKKYGQKVHRSYCKKRPVVHIGRPLR
jgi:hypothetical protein